TVTTIDLNKVLNKEAHIDYKLYVDSNSDIWVYSSNSEGLWLFSNVGKDSWQLSSIGHASYLTNNKIRSICEDHDKKIWIGMESEGISIYNKKNKQHTHHTKTESEYSLGSNKVWCFFYDEENTMWVGTMRNGISYYNKDFFPFQKTQLPYWHDVACQVEDNNNNLWIGTDGGGIYKIDPNGRVYIFNKENGKSFSNNIVCLYNDSKGRVWAGTYLEGFGCLNGEKFEQYPFSEDFKREPNNNSIWSITEDESGNIWLGNLRNGLHVLNPTTGKFHTYKRNNSNITDEHVMGLMFDKKKYIYAATCYGLNQINTETREIRSIVGNRKKTQSIKDTIQNNVFIDSRNLIWVGGREGLTIYDEKLDTLYYLNQVNKLKGSLVRGITEDNNRDIWVMTTEGITHIKVSENRAKSDYTFACQPYSNNDGLQTSDFIHGSISKNKNGHILIGGNGSFFNIDPSVTYNKSVSRVLFTRLRIFNNLIEPDSVYNGNAILSKNIELTDKIILKNSQSTFSIEFSVLEYIKAHNIQFSYRLKGVNENWNNLDGNQISFNNIAAGTYKLEVRASNSDGIWSEPTAINIVIEPPLWFSGWALTLYAILVLILIAYILYSNDRKHKKRLRYKEIELETQKQHEIYEMKLNFFTNLSHDFRTPLSLIIAPIDLLMKSNLGQEVNSTLHVIYKNAQSLLNLVNQILDFRKIEIHEMKLNLENGEYILFVKEVMNNFSVYIETTNLQLTFDKQIDNLY
ncbi:MAG: ligand-binding sensor domain-containing protein, partial [Phocaeicola sp.]